MTSPQNFEFKAIATVESPYKEKFAVPRQAGLVTAAQSNIVLLNNCNREEILRGLDGFSHLWITFVFHLVNPDHCKTTVRPPRLGGNQRLGVFATRSPFRPNPIGLSAVKLETIRKVKGQWQLSVSGGDWVDGTPVLDIKPYLPYADAITEASCGFASEPKPSTLAVTFSLQSQQQLKALYNYPQLKTLIEQVIGQQPQPAYLTKNHEQQPRVFGMRLYEFNIRWQSHDSHHEILVIDNVS